MRPTTLKIKGLRSYRTEQIIDFTGKELIAIIGDTGAGKSSLLEAICFALYGNCTWQAGSAGHLIADGGDGTLAVELTFRARGKTWTVTRTMSRTYSPPSIHRLTSLNDDTDISGASQVNSAVRRLVGFDYSTFLKAVVLPQGRFQELLQTPEGKRSSILKNILGLDDLTTVRDHALTMHTRLRPLLADMEQQRAGLPPDPAAVIQQATDRRHRATTQLAQLETVKNTVDALNADKAKHATLAAQCRKAGERLGERIPAGINEQYQSLVDLDGTLAAELGELSQQLEDQGQRQDDLSGALTAADSDGTGVEAAQAALATLTTLADQIPGINEEQHRLTDARTALATERDSLQTRQAIVAELSSAAKKASTEADGTEAAAKAAADRVVAARALLTVARNAANSATRAANTAQDTGTRARQKELSAETASRDAERAEHELRVAEHGLEAAQRANAAAHAAAASHPGDPCPVCVRELPCDFVPPTAEDIEQATSVQVKIKKLARRLGEKAAAARVEAQTAEAEFRKAQDTVAGATDAYNEAMSAVTEALGTVDLSCDDDVLLTDLLAIAQYH